jgi:hypothetical protein
MFLFLLSVQVHYDAWVKGTLGIIFAPWGYAIQLDIFTVYSHFLTIINQS